MSAADSQEFRPPKPIRGIRVGPIEVDCSSWGGEPDDPSIPEQRPRSLTKKLPPFEVEFHEAKSIEIVLDLGRDTTQQAAFLLAMDLISAIQAAAPDLKLAYDSRLSRTNSNGARSGTQVAVILSPQSYVAEHRLSKLVDEINAGLCLRFEEVGFRGACRASLFAA